MQKQNRVRVKICCISSVEEARMAVRYGADALGLVSAMPSGPGPIPEEQIAAIARTVPPPIATFLLTCASDPETVIAQVRRTGVSTVQLVDAFPPDGYVRLREQLPSLKIVQVIHVAGAESVAEAAHVAPKVDALLLDSGNPMLTVKELGGTGRVHDWRLSRQICAEVPVPVFLAGGLRAENVAEAIATVQPFGIDICSGVRTNGHLDENRLSAFFGAILSQFAPSPGSMLTI